MCRIPEFVMKLLHIICHALFLVFSRDVYWFF